LNRGAYAWVDNIYSENVGIRAAFGANNSNAPVEDLNTSLYLEIVTADVVSRVSSVNINAVRTGELERWIVSIR